MIDAPAIRTHELAKRYGSITALAGLSMTIPRGDVFGFLGPNGAGKTTAVKLLLGLTPPTSGDAEVLGAEIGDRDALRRVGYLPELFRYQSWLTAREVLALHCELAGIDRSAWQREIEDALAVVGLSDRGSGQVATFSKGMQQRLGLGVALIGTLLAETKLSNRGIGFLVIQAYSLFNMPQMYSLLIVLFVIAIGANALIGRVGRLDDIRPS